ncbi:tRNA (guanine(10)-N2)-methyltransferase homolog [Oscarella lobularis]|uniref:tRNA (guanine(10)-N2)-methyltransferase homolog n=1 Tax=Oscarella lobularis TaxID=121494 RepID=UPI0033143ECA
MLRCLFHYAQEHLEFRLPEFVSSAALAGIANAEIVKECSHAACDLSPFLIVDLPSEDVARRIAQRSVLMKSVIDLWGFGSDLSSLKSSILAHLLDEKEKQFMLESVTFRIRIEAFNKKCTDEYSASLIKQLNFLPFKGRVNLRRPDHTFCLFLDYGTDSTTPAQPYRLFFGREISMSSRHLLDSYSIKKRRYIGNTSMDTTLSFLMANQAKVKPGQLVLDPFVGTGSVLIACACYGAHVVGADIDRKILHGWGKTSRAAGPKTRGPNDNLYMSMKQYGLEARYVDVLTADAARPAWTQRSPLFDAIVTDPPYGVREGSKKIGSKKSQINTVADEYKADHIPAVTPYRLSEVLSDLLELANNTLTVGGRLVYWLPVSRADYEPSLIPVHPGLKLIANSEQVISGHASRRLLTMEKTTESKNDATVSGAEIHDAFRAAYFKRKN